jgi:hypothetical protein
MRHPLVAITAFAGLVLAAVEAPAQCTLPHTIANGQPADASKVMANFNALISCLSPGGSTGAIQYNAGSGALGGVGPLTNGQLVIGSTGNAPQAQTLTAGSGISIATGPGAITIAATNPTGANGLYRQTTSATPTTANTGLATSLNPGMSTFADSAVGLTIDSPSTGGAVSIVGRFKSAPTAPYTIKALVAATRNDNSYGAVGMGWFDGNSKLHLMAYSINAAGAPFFLVQRWNSVTSFNATDFASALNAFAQPIWLQVKDDGTNVSFGFGHDGANFLTIYSVAKSSGFLGPNGYSNVVFFNDARGGRSIGTIMSWSQE